jgi:hypothetical protein
MKRPLLALLVLSACTSSNTKNDDMSVMGESDAAMNADAAMMIVIDAAMNVDLALPTCTISGTSYVQGTVNPANACQSCQPPLSTTAWSPLSNGMSCGTSKICTDGMCESTAGCDIGGGHFGTGVINANNPCQICRPSSSTTAWTNRDDGATCGAGLVCDNSMCVSGCLIAATLFMPSAINPSNPCQSCQPSRSTAGFSAVLDGTTCNGNQFCVSGTCTANAPGCAINGASIAIGTIDPGNLCLACQPGQSSTQYTNLPDGTGCFDDSHICISGTCTTGCNIGGVHYTTGYLNPANRCQACDQLRDASNWTNVPDGRSCGTGKVCHGGTCFNGCTIGGGTQATGTANPANSCQSCQPGVAPDAWSPINNGASCGTGGICSDGTCYDHCVINSANFAIGALDPNNACASCEPALSPTSFSLRAPGSACGTGKVCDPFADCISGCNINGKFYFPDDIVGGCTVCNPSVSTTVAQPAADGTLCPISLGDGGAQFFPGGVCYQHVCRTDGCYIDGAFVPDLTIHPTNSCLQCRASSSRTSWSGREGVSCGTKAFCDNAGFCRLGCSIGGHYYSSGSSVDACTACLPNISTSVAQPAPDGTICNIGFSEGVCISQICKNGCYIDGAFRQPLSSNPDNSCLMCMPNFDPTFWYPAPEGTICGAGLTCTFYGSCGVFDLKPGFPNADMQADMMHTDMKSGSDMPLNQDMH